MTDINKQKFLAELAKLLTFMYEEDLHAALAMYNRLFDEAESEQAMLQFLVSPTRQAVVLARAYNAKERKLQVHAQAREEREDTDELPDFILAIERLRDEALDRGIASCTVPENQMSLFDDGDEPAEPEMPAVPVVRPVAAPAPRKPIAPAPEKPAAPAVEKPAEAEGEEASLNDLIVGAAIEENEVFTLEPMTTKTEQPTDESEGQVETAVEEEQPLVEEVSHEEVIDIPKEKKTSVGLLILYIILAIPLGLLGVAVLLIPTLLFLVLAAAIIYIGVSAFTSAFGGFAVFADIMVMLGISLAILSLGLLAFWTFVWFLGGVIGDFIRAIFTLGRKICVREVAVK